MPANIFWTKPLPFWVVRSFTSRNSERNHDWEHSKLETPVLFGACGRTANLCLSLEKITLDGLRALILIGGSSYVSSTETAGSCGRFPPSKSAIVKIWNRGTFLEYGGS